MPADAALGEEWIVDASGCDAERLRDLVRVKKATDAIVRTLDLTVIGEPLVHKFGGEGGVTALYLLGESHLACHTYPEVRSVTLNLYSCKKKPPFDFERCLRDAFGAEIVRITCVPRGAPMRGAGA